MSAIPDHLDFEVDSEVLSSHRRVVPGRTTAAAPRARATARVETRASDHLQTTWDWKALRDYVIRMAEETHGQFIPRDPMKEKGIFNGFINRHGPADAQRIARYVFEDAPRPGYWWSAPIRPGKFTKVADEAFAEIVLEQLDQS